MKKILILVLLVVFTGAGFVVGRKFFVQEVEVQELTLEELFNQESQVAEMTMDEMKGMMEDEAPFMGAKAGETIDYLDDFNPNVPPTFTAVDFDFTHIRNEDMLYFSGGSLIDINGDGVEEVFVGGGSGQEDALFAFENGDFVRMDDVKFEVSGKKEATYGSISLDMDFDERQDLLVARDDGVYLYLYERGNFVGEKLDIDFADHTVPVAITATDVNKDGYADLYISTFVDIENFKAATFNNPDHAKPNVLLLNNGDNTFEDITEKSGLVVNQNTFLSVFVDLDEDGDQDIALSNNTDTVQIFENNGDSTFSEVEDIPGISKYGFWMGLAVGDIDQDGDQDLFFSNIGNTIPVSLARGDLRNDQELASDYLMLENEGGMKFKDVTEERGLANLEFAWGATFADFNLDGRLDLPIMQNYIKWGAHKLNKLPGRFMMQGPNGKFLPITNIAGVENPYYGMAPLVSDFNQDGYPDLVYINLEGPVQAFINDGGQNHYLVVPMPDESGALGAKIVVEKMDGTKLYGQHMAGVGMLSDQSSNMYFGLGNHNRVKSVKVIWPDPHGDEEVIEDIEVDAILK